jgi:NitT/TauT family transport system substrate-binding protein
MLRVYFIAWLVLIPMFGGCDRASKTAGTAVAPLAVVRLGFFPNITHAQAVLGVSSRDFAAAVGPVKFMATPFNAGPGLIEALNVGAIDVGYVGPGPAINAFVRSHGDSIRVISGAASNGVLIVARKDSGIRSMSDLKGRKIATPQHGNTQDIAAKHYVTATLGQSNTDNILPIANADQMAAMARGEIDAAWDPEPWGSLLINAAGATLVSEEKDLWPGKKFALTVIVTTPKFLSEHPDVVQKLLSVNSTWTQRLATDPTRYTAQLEQGLAALAGKPLPPGVTAAALQHVLFTEDPSPATFDADAQWAFDLGLAREKPDLSGLIDLSILQKIQQRHP